MTPKELNAQLKGFEIEEMHEATSWRGGYCPPGGKRLVVLHHATGTQVEVVTLLTTIAESQKMADKKNLPFLDRGDKVAMVWVRSVLTGGHLSWAVRDDLRDQLLKATLSSG